MQICIDVINGYLKILKGAELSLKFDDDKNVKEYEIQNFRGHEVIYGDFFEARDELRFFCTMPRGGPVGHEPRWSGQRHEAPE